MARNKDGIIKLFTIKPKYNDIIDEWKGYDFEEIELNKINFPEVTFNNSPKEVKIKLIN